MSNSTVHQAKYPTVDFMLDAIAGWINKYRHAAGRHNEFEYCSPDDVRQIAKDLCVPESDLRGLAVKGPDSAELVEKMLLALGVDGEAVTKTNPAVMRDLQRLCVVCGNRNRCEHELGEGTAAGHFRNFCPNAYTLDALLKQKEQSPQH